MVENNFRIVPSTTQDTDLNRMSERSLGGDSLVRTPSVMSEADVSFYRGPVKTVPHPDSLHGGSLTMRRSGSFYMEESTIEESALGIRLRRVSLHRQIHSEAIVDQGWDAEDRKTQSLEAPHDHLDLDPISSHAPGTRREHLLECLEIFPSGDSRAQSIPRSYILGIAKESEGSNVSRSSKGIKKRVMRQQLGNCLQFRDFRQVGNLIMIKLSGHGNSRGTVADNGEATRYSQLITSKRVNAQVDPAFLGKPAISVRRNAIVVSLLEIRAILLFNRCFLFNMDGLSKLQTDMVLTRIKDGRESADVSETGQAYDFEFCALEGLLQALTTRLEKDFNQMNDEILRWVDTLANILFTPVLEGFRASKGDLNRMLTEIEENQVVLDTLLDDDEEMASMYLTELHRNPGSMRKTIDHEEMEMLLENYVQVVDDISIRGKVLMETLHDAESLVELRLDSLQNRLLLVNLIIQSVALVVASGSMVTATFGMNMLLPPEWSELPSSKYYFYGVCAIILFVMILGLAGVYLWTVRSGIYTMDSPHSIRRHRPGKLIGAETGGGLPGVGEATKHHAM
uniref:Magnesium transporter n=1 Tax=Rhodosorus marinus TaxID=101924 RepID=A0A7S2ZUH0_9RHOD|mmetsp:Transcript_33117/g.130212  ORF Transcript_33117/g.130212 Transcript_33117/m.130212 type:complete len:568 (+) Transcript_33117:604-2307(+)